MQYKVFRMAYLVKGVKRLDVSGNWDLVTLGFMSQQRRIPPLQSQGSFLSKSISLLQQSNWVHWGYCEKSTRIYYWNMRLRSYTIRTPSAGVHSANYTSSEGSNGNQGPMCFKAGLHIVDECYKFWGRNSLRGEGYNNPTLTHIYLFKSSLFITLIMFIYLLYHVYWPNHSWLFV